MSLVMQSQGNLALVCVCVCLCVIGAQQNRTLESLIGRLPARR
jgi:hypothetical protein